MNEAHSTDVSPLPDVFNVQRNVRSVDGSASTSQRIRICSLRETPYCNFCPGLQLGATKIKYRTKNIKKTLLQRENKNAKNIRFEITIHTVNFEI